MYKILRMSTPFATPIIVFAFYGNQFIRNTI
jgi:hypothetical protein